MMKLTVCGSSAKRSAALHPLVIAAALTIALLAVIWFDLSPLLRGPAPYPPEWQWSLRSEPPAAGLGRVLLCAAGILGLIAATALSAVRRRPRPAAAIVLGGAVLLGVALQWSLLDIVDDRSAADLLVARTLSPTFTSYYSVAVSPVARDVPVFLDRYAELLPSLPLHCATHPPGAVLFYRAILGVCDSAPGFAQGVVGLAGRLGVDPGRFSAPLQAPRAATALLAPLAILFLSAAAALPIAALTRRLGLSAAGAMRVGALWVLIPGVLLMVPEMDQLLSLPIVCSALFFLMALTRGPGDARCHLLAAAAGGITGAAGFVSYGAVFFGVFGWFAVSAFTFDGRQSTMRAAAALAIAAASALVVHLLPALWGYDPLGTFVTAMRLHRDRFTQPRSYLTWLVFNLWDFAVFLGFPLVVLAVRGVTTGVRHLIKREWAFGSARELRFGLATSVALVALDVTGAVRGEVGRIWIPLMPFFLVSAILPSSPVRTARVECTGTSARVALAIGALLLICALVTRIRWDVP